MKIIYSIITLCCLANHCEAQKLLPIVYADSISAKIIEADLSTSNWTISPDIKLDVHIITKCQQAQKIKFITNRDSIICVLKPNEKFDFIVLLNDKDTCYTRIESSALKNYRSSFPEIHDTIPFSLSVQNNIVFDVLLDNKDSIKMVFDTGATDFDLTRDGLKKLGINQLEAHQFQIGKQIYSNQYIYPVALAGDGIGMFGWNIFDGYVVEIDYEKSSMIMHSKMPKVSKAYSKFNIEYAHLKFCIHAILEEKGKKYPNRFLFDNGYQRTIMLDQDLVESQKFPVKEMPLIRKSMVQNSHGKEIPLLTIMNDKFILGKYILSDIPVQVLSEPNPARFTTHILGGEVLKRFNTILDFQNNVVYLKRNQLYYNGYIEQ